MMKSDHIKLHQMRDSEVTIETHGMDMPGKHFRDSIVDLDMIVQMRDERRKKSKRRIIRFGIGGLMFFLFILLIVLLARGKPAAADDDNASAPTCGEVLSVAGQACSPSYCTKACSSVVISIASLCTHSSARSIAENRVEAFERANCTALTDDHSSSGGEVGDSGPQTEVYFGNGCFWERQYAYANIELATAERPCLERSREAKCTTIKSFKRTPLTVTAKSGYAGGTMPSSNGRVCYHHSGDQGDLYGKLGHAEVVAVMLDNDDMSHQFAVLIRDYFDSFHENGGKMIRPDPGDRGPDYRNLIGIPGGVNGPLYSIVEASNTKNMELVEGQGDEKDVANRVHIMDITEFPFFMGETYHQFHSNFFGESYPESYKDALYNVQSTAGLLGASQCPVGSHY